MIVSPLNKFGIGPKSIPNNCNTLQIHIGDKASDGDWDEYYVSCEFEL